MRHYVKAILTAGRFQDCWIVCQKNKGRNFTYMVKEIMPDLWQNQSKKLGVGAQMEFLYGLRR